MKNPELWRPTRQRVESTGLFAFMQAQGFDDYASLHHWSITRNADFWPALADAAGLEFENPAKTVLEQPGDMQTARWFVGATLNFAEQLLCRVDEKPALIFRGECGLRREISGAELKAQVASVAAGLRRQGVGPGERVAAILPNCPEAVIAMLAAASLGAVWSSCSPDFGVGGIVDRFGQIRPKVLFVADGYRYNGKYFDLTATTNGVLAAVPDIELAVCVPFGGGPERATRTRAWEEFLVAGEALQFTPLPFDHPLFILYSSGTTGKPKCIVHGAGGTLLQHVKEHRLHCDVRPGDRLFYFTTCGWMMWNWLATGLASGATLVLFDGFPFADDGRILWSMAERERVTHFGTSARYIAGQEKAGIKPGREFDLSSIRVVLSTGSPLAPAGFDYVYRDVAPDVQLSSISGGTDIIGCFALGNPILPVRRGELQCLGLGMAVDVFDESGHSVRGRSGELVCTAAFPSMPTRFWNDADGSRYRDAYFARFPGVWAHGDFAELTDSGGLIIHGRSDAVLNPSGVRIGTAEIYRQVDTIDEVVESIAVGQHWDVDERVVLFVVLRDGVELDDELRSRIRQAIRSNTSPRHVPAKILAVKDIPRTVSGKIVEVAVRSVVHGEAVDNVDALANPEALRYFAHRPELAED